MSRLDGLLGFSIRIGKRKYAEEIAHPPSYSKIVRFHTRICSRYSYVNIIDVSLTISKDNSHRKSLAASADCYDFHGFTFRNTDFPVSGVTADIIYSYCGNLGIECFPNQQFFGGIYIL